MNSLVLHHFTGICTIFYNIDDYGRFFFFFKYFNVALNLLLRDVVHAAIQAIHRLAFINYTSVRLSKNILHLQQ